MVRLLVLLLAVLWGWATPYPAGAENRLGSEASPYLLQHATDPVHWWTWGPEALEEAQRLGRPILLSIGYSACHWCHVMQRESYADPELADVINTHYIPILIDREERPDLDASFQSTAGIMGWRTGWPLTLFLTPEAEPFFGGAYFPKEAGFGMASFRDVLLGIHDAFTEEPGAVGRSAHQAMVAMQAINESRAGTVNSAQAFETARAIVKDIDAKQGGFQGESKFPEVPALVLLWRTYIETGEAALKDAVTQSLAAMVDGAMHDHVGGGFFRYTVDPAWRIPHFEKMLDVNAALVHVGTEVWRETRDPAVERAVRRAVAFLLREMRLEGGAFAASLDADSLGSLGEEAEGAYYLVSPDEASRLLGENAGPFLDAFGFAATPDGETLFHRPGSDWQDGALDALATARVDRARPARDEKVLADWNGYTIRALAEAGKAFDEPTWVQAAERAFAFVVKTLTGDDGRLHHSWSSGTLGPVAMLDDLAAMSQAALTVFEATGRSTYLDQTAHWTEAAVQHHWDGNDGGFFASAADAGPVPVRGKSFLDQPMPSGNAQMIEVLARLYFLTGKAAYRDRALAALTALGGWAKRPSRGIASLMGSVLTLEGAVQVVVVGQRGEKGTEILLRRIERTSLPARVLQVITPGTMLPDTHPAWNKGQEDGKATAYVCRGTICSLPATDPETLSENLLDMRRAP